MDKAVCDIFSAEGIEFFAPVPMKYCRVTREDLILRGGIEKPETAIVFLIPYFTGAEEGNISLYARSLDYHLFCAELFPRICEKLSSVFGGRFIGFADKSPIDEIDAAARGGLGVIGDNHMLINEKYGSFVFIGEVITDVAPEALSCDADGAFEPKSCPHCGECGKVCPKAAHGECLSAVTQKKGELSAEEISYIGEYGSAWGCDICQTVCPLVKKAVSSGNVTPIGFFYRDRINDISSGTLSRMSDEDFKKRAFSWRGRGTVLRNLEILKK